MSNHTEWKNIPKSDWKTIDSEIVDGVGVIRLNIPAKRNAQSAYSCGEMTECLRQWEEDERVAVVVVFGTEEYYSAGMDLDEYIAQVPEDRYEHMEVFHRHYQCLIDYAKPTICAVAGPAFAGAVDSICHFDIRIMSENAVIGLPGPKHGIHSHFSPLWKLVGIGFAKLMYFTGDTIDAETALRVGLADKVVPVGTVFEESMAVAKRMARHGSVMQRRLKEVSKRAPTMEPMSAVAYETAMYREICMTDEVRVKVQASLDKISKGAPPALEGRI